MANGRNTKVCRIGNPKLDLILTQWIEEDLIENDHSEIELNDSDKAMRTTLTKIYIIWTQTIYDSLIITQMKKLIAMSL